MAIKLSAAADFQRPSASSRASKAIKSQQALAVDWLVHLYEYICTQFCQFPAKTGKLTTGPPRSCLRPLDPYIDGKLSARR
jgi:hypothetical protein